MNSDVTASSLEKHKVVGVFCELHPIVSGPSKADAALISRLRAPAKRNFLKKADLAIETQVDYLKNYLDRRGPGNEIYYKILGSRSPEYVGVVRLTELSKPKKFNWESLVVDPSASPMVAIEVMLLIYGLGFEVLDKEKCGPWEVDRDHARMMKLHDLIGMASVEARNSDYNLVSVSKASYFCKIDDCRKRLGLQSVRLSAI